MRIKANDDLIEHQVEHFKAVAACQGLQAAKAEFVNRLIGEVFWFEAAFGTRQTYELFQLVADQLVEHGRDAA
jgi:hypothetical protein